MQYPGLRSDPDNCTKACVTAVRLAVDRDSLCLHMALGHADKAELCDQLELIADSLPYRVDEELCFDVVSRLVPLLCRAHKFEEDLLFPAFVGNVSEPTRMETVRRLRSEHVQDQHAAEEISEELLRIGNSGVVSNPEAVGFMLRAFFESVRRHMAFEREYMFPVTAQTARNSVPGNL